VLLQAGAKKLLANVATERKNYYWNLLI